jgi:hypothetical protein
MTRVIGAAFMVLVAVAVGLLWLGHVVWRQDAEEWR